MDDAFHAPRGHTLAVAMRLAGCRIEDIQQFLGHTNPTLTLNVYSVPEAPQLARVLLRLPWFPTEADADPEGRHVGTDDTLLRALADASP